VVAGKTDPQQSDTKPKHSLGVLGSWREPPPGECLGVWGIGSVGVRDPTVIRSAEPADPTADPSLREDLQTKLAGSGVPGCMVLWKSSGSLSPRYPRRSPSFNACPHRYAAPVIMALPSGCTRSSRNA